MPLLSLALLAAPLSAGEPPPIINGEEAGEDDYPMAGGMLLDGFLDLGPFGAFDMRLFVCSSTLIAPDVVLLAGHCLDDYAFTLGLGTISDKEIRWTRTADLSSWDGSAILDWPEDSVVAQDWVVHPSFDILTLQTGLTLNYDIALLFLEEPILDVPLAYLPTPDEGATLAVDDEVVVVGWGQQSATNWWEVPPEGSYGIKQQGWSHIAELADYEMKIGEAESDVRKCHGDSGGPTFLYLDGTDESMRQIGVTSHAWDETDCFKTGGVDTRVDYYLDWIDEEMTRRCEDGSRVWCEVPGILEPGYVPGEEEGTTGTTDTGGITDTGGTTDGGTTDTGGTTGGTTDGGSTGGTTDGGTTSGTTGTTDGGSAAEDTASGDVLDEDPDAKGCSSTGGAGGAPAGLLGLLGLAALGRRRR